MLLKTRQGGRYTLFAVDPGTRESGFVRVDVVGNRLCLPVRGTGNLRNAKLAAALLAARPALVVCEKFEGGQFFGKSSIETVLFIGELRAMCRYEGIPFYLLPRRHVRKALTGKAAGKGMDARVRTALIEEFGDKGTRAAPGKTWGISSHAWSALAIAYTYAKYGLNKPA